MSLCQALFPPQISNLSTTFETIIALTRRPARQTIEHPLLRMEYYVQASALLAQLVSSPASCPSYFASSVGFLKLAQGQTELQKALPPLLA